MAVSFFGHIVTPEGVAMDPSKIKDVVERPVLQRLNYVRAFCIDETKKTVRRKKQVY